jgi:hypothetical protein
MKPMTMMGLALVILGVAALAFGRFSYTTDRQVIDMGPLTASVAEQHHVNIPDIAGVGAIIAGAVLVFFSWRTAKPAG